MENGNYSGPQSGMAATRSHRGLGQRYKFQQFLVLTGHIYQFFPIAKNFTVQSNKFGISGKGDNFLESSAIV